VNGDIDESVLGTYLSENLSVEWSTTITEAVTTCSSGANGKFFRNATAYE
jgi:hypothetical protein